MSDFIKKLCNQIETRPLTEKQEVQIGNIIAEGRPHGGLGNPQFPDGCECEDCEQWDKLNRLAKEHNL